MTAPDKWGRLLPPPAERDGAARTGREKLLRTDRAWWASVLLRGVVFSGGIFLALAVTLVLAYGGLVHTVFLWGQLSLAPIAVLFWVLASFTKAGDRWTAAYVAIWASELIIVSIGSALFW